MLTKILISLSEQAKKGECLTDLIRDLKRPAEESEVRISFNEKSRDFRAEGAEVLEGLKRDIGSADGFTLAPDCYEGVRINTGCGWILVRMSVHDPVMPINLESDVIGGNVKAAKKLLSLLQKYGFLQTRNLLNFTL